MPEYIQLKKMTRKKALKLRLQGLFTELAGAIYYSALISVTSF